MYEILVGPSHGLGLISVNKLHAVFEDTNRRASAGDLEAAITMQRERYRWRPGLLCQPKFRLRALELRAGELHFDLGPTDYFDYLATNHDVQMNAELVAHGIAVHDDADACLSNAIGNLAVVRSADDQIAALYRSDRVATFAGRLDLPGGHPEPARINRRLPRDEAVAHELFDAIQREVSEELGVERSHLAGIALLGVIRNLEDGRKPEMIFRMDISLDATEIEKMYRDAAGRDESTSLLLTTAADLQNQGTALTAPSQAALDFWAAYHGGR